MKLCYKIQNVLYDFRSRCQRFKRGWAYNDVWNMNSWFINTVKPMLTYLCHNHMGVPMEFENNPDGWKEVLNEMINCLEVMDEDNVYAFLGFCEIEDYERMTKKDYEDIYKTMEENKNRFFELFSKYYFDLWD